MKVRLSPQPRRSESRIGEQSACNTRHGGKPSVTIVRNRGSSAWPTPRLRKAVRSSAVQRKGSPFCNSGRFVGPLPTSGRANQKLQRPMGFRPSAKPFARLLIWAVVSDGGVFSFHCSVVVSSRGARVFHSRLIFQHGSKIMNGGFGGFRR